MPERMAIKREAMERQGTVINCRRRRYLIEGDGERARFQMGEEGLVHYAQEQKTGQMYRIKCFWEPDDIRLERSRYLVGQKLANLGKSLVDVLAGAPFELIDTLGGLSRFALIMKSVDGRSWKDLRQDAEQEDEYPPRGWPSFRTRILWAYGLAAAVERMEERGFVHADLSDGNILVVTSGQRGGSVALVDFDAYFNPKHPSNYRGTPNFVAPEIWDHGPAGVGSDRVAMSILIQEMLLAGDPEISASEAFGSQYSQDQICQYDADAHPILKGRYPDLAGILEATLRARNRDQRPAPKEWRQVLRRIFDQPIQGSCHLDSMPVNPAFRISMNVPGSQDLSQPPYGIHANLVRLQDGSVHLRVHENTTLRVRFSGDAWREIAGGTDLSIAASAMFFDPDGTLAGQITLESGPEIPADPAHAELLAAFDGRITKDPNPFTEWWDGVVTNVRGSQTGLFMLGFAGMLLLLLAFLLLFRLF